MFVIFEGLDKAGKGTLEWEFLKATNFKHIVIDRGPAGYIVFDNLFNRQTDEGDIGFIHSARIAMDSGDFMVVYCRVNSALALARIAEHNETCPYDYNKAQNMYDWCVGTIYDKERVVTIDTSMSIEECVNEIIKKLEALKGEHN